ncbi:hypothetical protein KKH27_14275 [bacterium]|nr:hypothetical protein [bacterium]MBU1984073.1 hypothetical protein [bacterium]
MTRKKATSRTYSCDVCSLQFRVTALQESGEQEISCPRCRTPFVRPVERTNRKSDALRQLTLYRGLACG